MEYFASSKSRKAYYGISGYYNFDFINLKLKRQISHFISLVNNVNWNAYSGYGITKKNVRE